MKADQVSRELSAIADPAIAGHSQRFFRTGKGEYGEGDRFLGIRVPQQRKIARKYRSLPLPEIHKLLCSEFHEERLTALFILELQFASGDETDRHRIFDFYLEHIEYINNWDLIDGSAPKIVGAWLFDKPRNLLYEWVHSSDLWKQRIAMLATFYFIRKGELDDTFRIADLLLQDNQDLIHKAVGWMLREAGKRDHDRLEAFLKPRYHKMPRTMLRYTIERFPEPLRKAYLNGEIPVK